LVSLRRQLEDRRAAVDYAGRLEGVDAHRIVLWGMSLGGGHAILTTAADPRIAATVSVVPMVDGLAFLLLKPAPPGVTLRLTWRSLRRMATRKPVMVPVAGPPRSFAFLAARARPPDRRQ
jgi:acetyl esterase/lipase